MFLVVRDGFRGIVMIRSDPVFRWLASSKASVDWHPRLAWGWRIRLSELVAWVCDRDETLWRTGWSPCYGIELTSGWCTEIPSRAFVSFRTVTIVDLWQFGINWHTDRPTGGVGRSVRVRSMFWTWSTWSFSKCAKNTTKKGTWPTWSTNFSNDR